MSASESNRVIAVSGASGLIGKSLVAALESAGHETRRLVRRAPTSDIEIRWDPATGVDAGALESVNAVVHLAGESIASGRWTAEKKRRIRESRVDGTRLLAESIAQLDDKPKALICASAIGFYGDRGAEQLDETSAVGEGFLPEVCQLWEAATQPAADADIRVANVRFGAVLGKYGGALAKMLTPFKLGVGGRLGDGRQYMSWIALTDAVRAIQFVIDQTAMQGPINIVAPHPVINREYTKTLGKVLRRPTIFPMPAFAARLAFGELADALLLASARVSPVRLTEAGFSFEYPQLEPALRHELAPQA